MPDAKLNFTKAAIDALPLPETGKRKLYHDTKVRGLCIQVTSTGARTFYVYRWAAGKPQKIRVGPYPDMSVEQARKKAEEENAAIARGEDPAEVRRKGKADKTFGDLFTWYFDTYSRPRKRSWKNDERNFKNHLGELAPVKASKITKGMVREIHMAIANKGKKGGPGAANRVLALISVVFSKAIAHELINMANPAKGVEPFPEQSRDRRLSADEVPRLLAALEAEPNETVRDAVFMLLFTGARKSNVMAMRWEEVDWTARTWRIPMTKNGKPQLVPLEEAEIDILRARLVKVNGSPWVFPGRKDTESGHIENIDDGWKRVLDRAGIDGLWLHDLRRSLGSWMVDTGASLPIIGQTLHHQSQATTAVYARLSMDPVREAKARAHQALREAGVNQEFSPLQ